MILNIYITGFSIFIILLSTIIPPIIIDCVIVNATPIFFNNNIGFIKGVYIYENNIELDNIILGFVLFIKDINIILVTFNK